MSTFNYWHLVSLLNTIKKDGGNIMKKNLSLKIVGIFVMVMLITTALPALGQINNVKVIKKTFNDPTWEWARGGGGFSLDYGKDVTVDNNGNVYIIGKYFALATFGATTLTGYGPIDSWDIFVAKLNTNGDWLWAVGAGGTFNDEGAGIALDDDGNVYITGTFYDVAWFGNITLTAYGYQDIFIAKLDNDGNWLWALRAGGHAGESAYGIAVDGSGNSYVTGHFMNLATFGTIPLNSEGGADVFVVKLDTGGNWLWAIRGGGSSPDYVCDIALDSDGNTYLTGDFEGSATFGADTITSLGNVDVFIAKLDNDGNWLWARSGGSSSIERGYDVAVDDSGNAYVTGVFLVSITFGTTTLTSQGEWDVYVLKLDTNGDWQWAVRGGSSSADGAWGISLDNSGNPYITGVFTDFSTFGTTTLTSQGIRDVFAAKLDVDGDWQWAISAGGADWDEGYAVAVDSSGYVYSTGYFDVSAAFGTTTLTSEGEYDVFIAKLSHEGVNQPPDTPIITGPINGKVGTSYDYTFNATDPSSDPVMYIIDWGDDNTEWTEYGDSGIEFTLKHTWNENGEYTIKAKAIDFNGAESDWGEHTVTMPKNKFLMNTLIQSLIERFPNAFRIFRYILRI